MVAIRASAGAMRLRAIRSILFEPPTPSPPDVFARQLALIHAIDEAVGGGDPGPRAPDDCRTDALVRDALSMVKVSTRRSMRSLKLAAPASGLGQVAFER